MRTLLSIFCTAAIVAIAATAAMAQIDVDISFDPTSASAGDEVHLNVSVANQGADPVLADIDLTVTLGDFTVGPLLGKLPLAAGEQLTRDVSMVIPPAPVSGDLTLDLAASVGEFQDSSSATLTLMSSSEGSTDQGLTALAQQLFAGMGISTSSTPTEQTSFGGLKQSY